MIPVWIVLLALKYGLPPAAIFFAVSAANRRGWEDGEKEGGDACVGELLFGDHRLQPRPVYGDDIDANLQGIYGVTKAQDAEMAKMSDAQIRAQLLKMQAKNRRIMILHDQQLCNVMSRAQRNLAKRKTV